MRSFGLIVAVGFVLCVGGCGAPPVNPPGKADKPTIVLNVISGENDLHSVAMALHLAEHSLADGRTTVLFFNVHAPAIASKKLPKTVKFGEEPPIRQQLAELIRKGAKVYVCPFCAKAAGLREADLAEGVEMATREKLFVNLHANSVVFTY
jgi:predicted peroxiredoxin